MFNPSTELPHSQLSVPQSDTPQPGSSEVDDITGTFSGYRVTLGPCTTATISSDMSGYSALLPGKKLEITKRQDVVEHSDQPHPTTTKERHFWPEEQSLSASKTDKYMADRRLELDMKAITASLKKEKMRAHQQQASHFTAINTSQTHTYIDIPHYGVAGKLLTEVSPDELQGWQGDRIYPNVEQNSYTIASTQTATVTALTPQRGHDIAAVTSIESNDKAYLCVGVYDGHGKNGWQCSMEVACKMPRELLNRFSMFSKDMTSDAALINALKTSFAAVNYSLENNTARGSTACLAIIEDDTLTLANVGDSRAVVIRRKDSSGTFTAEQLTTDHKTRDPQSLKSMDKRGSPADAIRYRNHRHGLTRKFGDIGTPGLSVRPKVTQTTMELGDYLIIASDGVWDYLLPEQLAELIEQLEKAGCNTPAKIAPGILAFVRRVHKQCAREYVPVHPDDMAVTVTCRSIHKKPRPA